MGNRFSYQLVRSKRRRKTLSLHIKEDGRIVVYVPHRTPGWEIEKFVRAREQWIEEKLSERKRTVNPPEKTFLPGEEFLFLGDAFPLEVRDPSLCEAPLRLSFGKFILSQSCLTRARDLFIEWYKKEARERLADRVDYYSNRFQLFPRSVKITSARSRWGSCSRHDQLCFSWRLMMAPLKVIDYVLLHELVHIKEKNHSRRFWSYLGSLLPDYKGHRRWLRDHEKLLKL